MVWQRHESRGSSTEGPLETWPDRVAFRSWPFSRPGGLSQIALPLIVADWKVNAAASNTAVPWGRTLGGDWVTDIPEDVIDPAPPPERDPREVYAAELAVRPEVLRDLSTGEQGDGIELVLERADLTAGERVVIRAFLAGDDVITIAEDLHERPQTVGTLLRNALHRLRWLGQNAGVDPTFRHRGERGNVRDERHSSRTRSADVPRSAPARRGAERQLQSSGGPGAGRLRGLRS